MSELTREEKDEIIAKINSLLLRGEREASVLPEQAIEVKTYFEKKGWKVQLKEGYLSFQDPEGRTLLKG